MQSSPRILLFLWQAPLNNCKKYPNSVVKYCLAFRLPSLLHSPQQAEDEKETFSRKITQLVIIQTL